LTSDSFGAKAGSVIPWNGALLTKANFKVPFLVADLSVLSGFLYAVCILTAALEDSLLLLFEHPASVIAARKVTAIVASLVLF
jgi:hypothetical protein